MRERPIIFSAPMVRAILDGRKTVTRRVVNMARWRLADGSDDFAPPVSACPYAPRDRLWVREAWQAIDGNERARRILTEPHPSRGWIEYAATVPEGYEPPPRWRPSIHMPRWASRITLEITAVRVERLQDISEADAVAEGCGQDGSVDGVYVANNPRGAFCHLWKQINGPDSWEANPWVWVVAFRRITAADAAREV